MDGTESAQSKFMDLIGPDDLLIDEDGQEADLRVDFGEGGLALLGIVTRRKASEIDAHLSQEGGEFVPTHERRVVVSAPILSWMKIAEALENPEQDISKLLEFQRSDLER